MFGKGGVNRLANDAADVVGLEDGGVDLHRETLPWWVEGILEIAHQDDSFHGESL
jgi:hypothetical protein